jgi:riboflavin synthase
MFTGIVETTGVVTNIEINGTNKVFYINSPLSNLFKADQSVAHNGVCLTVESINENIHRVTAVEETLKKTNLNYLQKNHIVNIERCMPLNGRLDGHFVQGHIDTIGKLLEIKDENGSWLLKFSYPEQYAALLIEKGSIAMNGISVTIFNVTNNNFSVAVIPYTYEHTNIKQLATGMFVNLEFDMVGKYIVRKMGLEERLF